MDELKIFIWIVQIPSQEYGKRATGARLTIIAPDEGEARRLMDEMMPKGQTIDALLWRKLMHDTQPKVFYAKDFVELTMNDGRKTQAVIHGQQAGA